MYTNQIKGDRLYHTKSLGYGESVELFGSTENGETPMSLLNIALASCVTMCAQSYWKQKFGQTQLALTTDIVYNDRHFELRMSIPKISKEIEDDLREFIASRCRVKQLLASDVQVDIVFHKQS